MGRASLLFMIFLGLCGCRTPQVEESASAPPKPLELQLPSFDRPEVIKVRMEAGYVVVRDTKMHAAGDQAEVLRKGQVVAQIEFEPTRRRPYVIARIVSGRPKAGDQIKLIE